MRVRVAAAGRIGEVRSEDRDALVEVGLHYRFDPVSRDLVDRIPAPARASSEGHTTAPTPACLSGAGGVIPDGPVHELDMIRWLVGSDVVRVAALTAAAAGPEGARTMIVALTLELADGGLAAVCGGYR